MWGEARKCTDPIRAGNTPPLPWHRQPGRVLHWEVIRGMESGWRKEADLGGVARLQGEGPAPG